MNTIPLKRGDTIQWVAVYEENDEPVDLTDYTITCQVNKRSNGELVGSMDITKSDQVADKGQYALTADTSNWPVTELVADIKYTLDGEVAHTETFGISLKKSETP